MLYNIGIVLESFITPLCLIGGVSIGGIILFLAFALYPPMTSKFKIFLKSVPKYNSNMLKVKEDVEFKSFVSIMYNRLGYKRDYSYFMSKVKSTTNIIILGSLVLLIFGLFLIFYVSFSGFNNLIFIAGLVLVGIAIILIIYSGNISYAFEKDTLFKEINLLNKSQIIELPVLISNFVAIVNVMNKTNITSFLNQYLVSSGSLRTDIKMFLASGANANSIDSWRDRVMKYSTIDISDYVRVLELMQSAFLDGYTETVGTSLLSVRDSIQHKVIDKTIENTLEGKRIIMTAVSSIMVIVAIFVFLIPYIIQIVAQAKSTISGVI